MPDKIDVPRMMLMLEEDGIVDTYNNCLIPFPDAKVASTLCIVSPIKYVVRHKFTIDDNIVLHGVGKI